MKKIIGQIIHDVKFFRRHVKIIPHIIKAAQVSIKNFGERLKCSMKRIPAVIAASITFKNALETLSFNSTPQDLFVRVISNSRADFSDGFIDNRIVEIFRAYIESKTSYRSLKILPRNPRFSHSFS
jgi:hypothetical protein